MLNQWCMHYSFVFDILFYKISAIIKFLFAQAYDLKYFKSCFSLPLATHCRFHLQNLILFALRKDEGRSILRTVWKYLRSVCQYIYCVNPPNSQWISYRLGSWWFKSISYMQIFAYSKKPQSLINHLFIRLYLYNKHLNHLGSSRMFCAKKIMEMRYLKS